MYPAFEKNRFKNPFFSLIEMVDQKYDQQPFFKFWRKK